MIKLLKKVLWTLPFICFLTGYLILDIFYNKEIETPCLVGMTVGQAFTILSDINLNARLLTYKEDSSLAEGTIVSQIPAASQKIKENQSVFLVVSRLPQKIKAPQLLLQSPETIAELATKHKLRIKTFRVTSTYPENQCCAQEPIAGQSIEHDTMIAYLSAGLPKTVLVPHLKNRSTAEVLAFLEHHGMTADLVHQYPTDAHHSCHYCIIRDQRPLAGSIITLNPLKPLHFQLQAEAPLP